MNASDFRRIILFMANKWDYEMSLSIFGNVMGSHYWLKWCQYHDVSPDYATMRLFYEIDDENLQKLIVRALEC